MEQEHPKRTLTPSTAILIGSVMVSLSILLSGGVVRVGKPAPIQPATAQVSVTPTPKPVTLNDVKAAFSQSVIKFGDVNNKLVVLEIADPSCPYCHIAAGKNPELNKQAGARFTLVSDGGTYVAPVPEIAKLVQAGTASYAYIYTPGHGAGEMGTKAMYCAQEKGKFWPVHDLIMTNAGYNLLNNSVQNNTTKSQELADFLKPVFDPVAMKQCLDSGKYDSQLQLDTSLATSLQISGTPGYYLNATKFAGAYSYTDMEPAVKSILGN